MGCCGSMVVAGVVVFCFFFSFLSLILWCFSGSGGDGFGGLFMFKICVNGERDKYQFLILFLLHFCSIFCFGRREI